jgi:hypothetical protein
VERNPKAGQNPARVVAPSEEEEEEEEDRGYYRSRVKQFKRTA